MIGFHLPEEPEGYLSNWYHAEFDYAGVHYVSSEQFMMYQKVLMGGRYDLAEKIMKTADPSKMKKLAGKDAFPEYMENGIDAIWQKNSKHIVGNGVRAKFTQNPELLKKLLKTGNEILCECAGSDKIWGIGINLHDPKWHDIHNWNGRNKLGMILMELREEFRREIAVSGEVKYTDYKDAEPNEIWRKPAAELRRMPQFYSAINVYADRLQSNALLEGFYSESMAFWENEMRTNMGGGLSVPGFFEMKQEIYEMSARMEREAHASDARKDFCRRYLPLLEALFLDEELNNWCKHETSGSHNGLYNILIENFMPEAYKVGLVIKDYNQVIQEGHFDVRQMENPTSEWLKQLTEDQLLAVIAWHFRQDHFCEGSLIEESIGSGSLLLLFQAYCGLLR